jgi:hypothetical protein
MDANRFLGTMLAQSETNDPATLLARVQGLAAELTTIPKDANGHDVTSDGVSKFMFNGLVEEMRARDSRAASAFFDAIPDSAKTAWMFPAEAFSRFKDNGIDAAIKLSESQTNEDFAKRAASGAWWGLAQKNRDTALEWIESLPQGPFKQGVLGAVMMDSIMRSASWGSGSEQATIEAGATLLSKNSQMDYYAYLAGSKWLNGSPGLIERLPISDAERLEIYRRLAPIKSK